MQQLLCLFSSSLYLNIFLHHTIPFLSVPAYRILNVIAIQLLLIILYSISISLSIYQSNPSINQCTLSTYVLYYLVILFQFSSIFLLSFPPNFMSLSHSLSLDLLLPFLPTHLPIYSITDLPTWWCPTISLFTYAFGYSSAYHFNPFNYVPGPTQQRSNYCTLAAHLLYIQLHSLLTYMHTQLLYYSHPLSLVTCLSTLIPAHLVTPNFLLTHQPTDRPTDLPTYLPPDTYSSYLFLVQ